MAEIDKALPNSKRTTIELPDQNQIQEELVQEINKEQEQPDNIEIIETDEGGAEISFDTYVEASTAAEDFTDMFNRDDEMVFVYKNRDLIVNLQDTFGVGTDQPVINFFVHKENVELKLLPYRFNMQDMFRKEILHDDMLFTKIGWVYHFNAIPNNVDSELTTYWMKKTYEYFHGGQND